MKLRIEIENGKQLVEVCGNPMELLLELTCFFARQEDCKHLIKHALKLAEVAAKEMKENNGRIDYETSQTKEGTKIIAEFMQRYESDMFKDKKN